MVGCSMKEIVGGCCVCSDDKIVDGNPLVKCEGHGCSVLVHIDCYGIVNAPKPTDSWFCRRCESQERAARVRCELCPFKDGALKRTDCGGWCHVICALFIPDATFGNMRTLEPILLKNVPLDRFSRLELCYLCTEHGRSDKAASGACIRCNNAGCRQHFHVTCGQVYGLLCEQITEDTTTQTLSYYGYCQQHFPKGAKSIRTKLRSPAIKSVSTKPPPNSENNSKICVTKESNASNTNVKKTNKDKSTPPDISGDVAMPLSSRDDSSSDIVVDDFGDAPPELAPSPLPKLRRRPPRSAGSKPPQAASPASSLETPPSSAGSASNSKRRQMSSTRVGLKMSHSEAAVSSISRDDSLISSPPSPDARQYTCLRSHEKKKRRTSADDAETLKKRKLEFPSSISALTSPKPISIPLAALSRTMPPPAKSNASCGDASAVSTLQALSSSAVSDALKPSDKLTMSNASVCITRLVEGETSRRVVSPESAAEMQRDETRCPSMPPSVTYDVPPSVTDDVPPVVAASDPVDERSKVGSQVPFRKSSSASELRKSTRNKGKEIDNLQRSAKKQGRMGMQLPAVAAKKNNSSQPNDVIKPTLTQPKRVTKGPFYPPKPCAKFRPIEMQLLTEAKMPCSNAVPKSFEQLLEQQWQQGIDYLMNEGQRLDISNLISHLNQLRNENQTLEDRINQLTSRRDSLLAQNARLSLPCLESSVSSETQCVSSETQRVLSRRDQQRPIDVMDLSVGYRPSNPCFGSSELSKSSGVTSVDAVLSAAPLTSLTYSRPMDSQFLHATVQQHPATTSSMPRLSTATRDQQYFNTNNNRLPQVANHPARSNSVARDLLLCNPLLRNSLVPKLTGSIASSDYSSSGASSSYTSSYPHPSYRQILMQRKEVETTKSSNQAQQQSSSSNAGVTSNGGMQRNM